VHRRSSILTPNQQEIGSEHFNAWEPISQPSKASSASVSRRQANARIDRVGHFQASIPASTGKAPCRASTLDLRT
jgi:hypothetical protein